VSLPFFIGLKPRLWIRQETKKKYAAELQWLKRSWQLETVSIEAAHLIFQWHVDIVHVEIDLQFHDEQTFSGVVDFPVGHFRIRGTLLKKAEVDG
jgi:hypothetical protein